MKKLVLLAALVLAGCAQPGAPSSQPPSTAASCPGTLKPALEVDLYFGRDKQAGGQVSEAEWAAFLADTVTPRFPEGLSVIDVAGQWRNPAGTVVRERSKLLVLVVFDAPAHEARLSEIIATYNQRFGQHGVFRSQVPVCAGI